MDDAVYVDYKFNIQDRLFLQFN